MSRIYSHHPAAVQFCTKKISQALRTFSEQQNIICVCIGTDRSTGDALGPMVGTMLTRQPLSGIHVYGTLDDPVHALNLEETMNHITHHHQQSIILAIDACLGKAKSVGSIQVGLGPIKPGAGVHKDLPEIGHLHITGIVNVSGFMEYFVLQNTRLSLVMKMAEIISTSIHSAILHLKHQKPYDIKK